MYFYSNTSTLLISIYEHVSKTKNCKCENNRFVPFLHPENSNGIFWRPFLTGNNFVTVPVIGDGCLIKTLRTILVPVKHDWVDIW